MVKEIHGIFTCCDLSLRIPPETNEGNGTAGGADGRNEVADGSTGDAAAAASTMTFAPSSEAIRRAQAEVDEFEIVNNDD